MFAHERKKIIMNKLDESSSVVVTELSKEFGTSDVTIRRDLQELENDGLLKRTHGGAVKLNKTSIEPNIKELGLIHVAEKKAIARMAYNYINDGDAIIIDSSTSAGMLAKHLREGQKKDISVITNSFRVVMELLNCPHLDIIHTGGELRSNVQSSIGMIAEHTLATLRVDKAFIGVNGIDFKNGITTPNLYESKIKSLMIECANETFILADSSKFNCTFLSIVCPIDRLVPTIITDNNVSEENIYLMKDKSIKYRIAASDGDY